VVACPTDKRPEGSHLNTSLGSHTPQTDRYSHGHNIMVVALTLLAFLLFFIHLIN